MPHPLSRAQLRRPARASRLAWAARPYTVSQPPLPYSRASSSASGSTGGASPLRLAISTLYLLAAAGQDWLVPAVSQQLSCLCMSLVYTSHTHSTQPVCAAGGVSGPDSRRELTVAGAGLAWQQSSGPGSSGLTSGASPAAGAGPTDDAVHGRCALTAARLVLPSAASIHRLSARASSLGDCFACVASSGLRADRAPMLAAQCQRGFWGTALPAAQPCPCRPQIPCQIEAAHKKGGGSTKNGRDSNGQRRGVKVYGGQPVKAGGIIVRQVGCKVPLPAPARACGCAAAPARQQQLTRALAAVPPRGGRARGGRLEPVCRQGGHRGVQRQQQEVQGAPPGCRRHAWRVSGAPSARPQLHAPVHELTAAAPCRCRWSLWMSTSGARTM